MTVKALIMVSYVVKAWLALKICLSVSKIYTVLCPVRCFVDLGTIPIVVFLGMELGTA
tara:strand:+ start:29 stop:202 length:174 start_codon:yes stop_codon:yes gene_type:complete